MGDDVVHLVRAERGSTAMAYNSHGHTPAAWTTVIIVFLAFVLGSIAVLTQNWPLFWIGGAGLVVVGGIVGKVMQMMGLGQGENPATVGRQADAEVAAVSDNTVATESTGSPEKIAAPENVVKPAGEAAG